MADIENDMIDVGGVEDDIADSTVVDMIRGEVMNSIEYAKNKEQERYSTYLTTGNWKSESILAHCLEVTLAHRYAISDYERFTNRYVSSSLQAKAPEYRYCKSQGRMTIPRCYPPFLGYPITVDGIPKTIVLSSSSGLKGMLETLDIIGRNRSRCWAFREGSMVDLKSGNNDLDQLMSQLYEEVPIHIFTETAVEEVKESKLAEPWTIMYDMMIEQGTHPGMFGVLHDNSLIDVRPYEEDDRENHRNIELRRFREEWLGFIDCTYSPANTECCRIMSLSHGVMYKIKSQLLMTRAEKLIHIAAGRVKPIATRLEAKEAFSNDRWMLHFMGKFYQISSQQALSIIQERLSMMGTEVPSVHVFEDMRVISIAISSGCLMKMVTESDIDITTNDSDKLWFDSIEIRYERYLHMIGWNGLNKRSPTHFVRTSALLTPYCFYNQPPRPLLAASMARQAMCKPRVELSSTMAPIDSVLPVVRTPLMQKVISEMNPDQHLDIPGRPLLILVSNWMLNYEDSGILNERVNDQKLFAYKSIVYHPVPHGERTYNIGEIIDSSTVWWKPAYKGKILKQGVSVSKSRYIVASALREEIEIGDKLGNSAGQKVTISCVTPDERMPVCIDCDTNEEFTPDLIMAASSIFNRVTAGQIYEIWAGMNAVGTTDYDRLKPPSFTVTHPLGLDRKNIKPRVCNIYEVINGERYIVNDCTGKPVVADYGIGTMWLLSHVASDKQHHSHEVPRGLRELKGRLHGAPVRYGEMDTGCMAQKGMFHVLQEMSDSADTVSMSVCCNCRKATNLCDCQSDESQTTDVLLRMPIVKLDQCRSIATLNSRADIATKYNYEESDDDLRKHRYRGNTVWPETNPQAFEYYTD